MPIWLKRTLTTMQISQFVIGAPFAFAHLFIEYQSPISVPYTYQFSSLASTVASSVASAATSADYGAYAKKLLLRAAGREGLAENVLNNQGHTFGIDALHPAQELVKRYETRYREELDWTHCLDTSGQTLAIYLNVLYLLPLTWLFGQFFVKSYMQRLERRRSSTVSQKAQLAIQSTRDASKGVGRRVSEAFEDSQGGINDLDEIAIVDEEEVKSALNDVKQAAKVAKAEIGKAASGSKKGMSRALDEMKGEADRVKEKARNEFQVDLDKVKEKYESVKSEVNLDTVQETYENVKSGIVSTAQNVMDTISTDQGDSGVERQENEKSSISNIGTVTDRLQESAGSAVESVKNTVSDVLGLDLKHEDTNSQDEPANDKSHGHDNQSTADKSHRQEHPLTKAQKNDDTSIAENADDGAATDDKADDDVVVNKKKPEDGKQPETAEEDKSKQAQRPDQEVRRKDPDGQSNAEPRTGDARAAKSPADERTLRDDATQESSGPEIGRGVHPTSKPNKEESSVEDSSKQDSPAQNKSRQEKQMKQPESISPKDQGASWIHVDHNDDDTHGEKSSEQVKGARTHATKEGKDSGNHSVTSDSSKQVEGTQEGANGKLTEQPKKHDRTTNKGVEKFQGEPAGGASHREPTAKSKSGNQQPPKDGASKIHHTPNDSAHLSYADVVAEHIDDDHEQKDDAEGQNPSDAATPARGVPSSDTNKGDLSGAGANTKHRPEQTSKNTSAAGTKQTQSSSTKTTSGDKGNSASRSSSPQWFENLTTGIDSPSKQKQDKHDRDIPKQDQDAIIADSEPVRDEVKDRGDIMAKDTATSPSKKKEQDSVKDTKGKAAKKKTPNVPLGA